MGKIIFFLIAAICLLIACEYKNDKLEQELIARQNEAIIPLKDMKSLANVNARYTQVCAIPPGAKRIPLENLKNGNSLMMKEAQLVFKRKNIYSETDWNLIFFRENTEDTTFLKFNAQLVNLFFDNKVGKYCTNLQNAYFVRIKDANKIIYALESD